MSEQMSDITAAEAQAAIAADEQRRSAEFIEEFKALQDKHKCDLVPVITLSGDRVIPQFNVALRK